MIDRASLAPDGPYALFEGAVALLIDAAWDLASLDAALGQARAVILECRAIAPGSFERLKDRAEARRREFRDTAELKQGRRWSKAAKVAYVKGEGQDRDHSCHWPGCDRQVKPAVWGCREHWFALPADLRDRIWKTFNPGQERTQTPSHEYVAAARAVQAWITEHRGGADDG